MKLSSNVVGDYNEGTKFSRKSLLTNTQVLRLCKALANGSSANIKLSKTQLQKVGQLGGFLGRLLGPLLTVQCSNRPLALRLIDQTS